MNPQHQTFLDEIASDIDFMDSRMVYADFLEELGDTWRARAWKWSAVQELIPELSSSGKHYWRNGLLPKDAAFLPYAAWRHGFDTPINALQTLVDCAVNIWRTPEYGDLIRDHILKDPYNAQLLYDYAEWLTMSNRPDYAEAWTWLADHRKVPMTRHPASTEPHHVWFPDYGHRLHRHCLPDDMFQLASGSFSNKLFGLRVAATAYVRIHRPNSHELKHTYAIYETGRVDTDSDS